MRHHSRRDFLKYVGFSTAVASLAACEGPVINSIPYVVKPDDVIPGIPDYYASSIADGFDFANVLVKVREGRPIKIEPNKEAPHGITNARVQASVLSLYDNNRLRGPMADAANPSNLPTATAGGMAAIADNPWLRQIAVMVGKESESVDYLPMGDLGAVAKLNDTGTGDTLSVKSQPVKADSDMIRYFIFRH